MRPESTVTAHMGSRRVGYRQASNGTVHCEAHCFIVGNFDSRSIGACQIIPANGTNLLLLKKIYNNWSDYCLFNYKLTKF